jgi:integrase/recombinase XerD
MSTTTMTTLTRTAKTRRARPLTWEAALERYETALRAKRASPRTLKRYLFALKVLRGHVAKRPDEITLEDLRSHVVALLTGEAAPRRKPLPARTVAPSVAAVKGFFALLGADGLLREDPTFRLDSPKVPPSIPGAVLTPAEVRRVLLACDTTTAKGLRDRAILELLYATGLRHAEARALKLEDLDRKEREIVVRSGKGEKPRIVPLARSAYEAVSAYLERGRAGLVTDHEDSSCYLFLTTRGRKTNDMTLHYVLSRLVARAGVKKHVSPHTFRRTFATSLLKAGVSVRHIQALLGHTSLNTTAKYLRLEGAELRREILTKHPRERMDI